MDFRILHAEFREPLNRVLQVLLHGGQVHEALVAGLGPPETVVCIGNEDKHALIGLKQLAFLLRLEQSARTRQRLCSLDE